VKRVAIIGAGPAGLIAAEHLAKAGLAVTLYDRMASAGRKFLMAGRGGLNLTHDGDVEAFLPRYGAAADWIAPMLRAFPPETLRAWAEELGVPLFVGTSGRVFPQGMKATPLLRAWLRRLDGLGVRFAMRHRWRGWREGALVFETPTGEITAKAEATLLALGGGSWARLGSDGGWVDLLTRAGVAVAPLRPANCGFVAPWSDVFRARAAGGVLKPVVLTFDEQRVQGEVVITAQGVEGGAVYALAARVRDRIEATGEARVQLDLRPGLAREELTDRLAARGALSLANLLRKRAGLSEIARAMVLEGVKQGGREDLVDLIKAYPLRLVATDSLERAISSAGGVRLDELEGCRIARLTNVYVAGEMVDWEAPTGGYLLQGCFSTGAAAARQIIAALDGSRFAGER
jgi:uncharacterized flavoprotein (TIGR03862 family)